MKTQTKSMAALIAGAAVLALAGGSAWADTTNVWALTSGTGNFTNAANWDAGTVPTTAIAAFFTNAGTYSVQFTSSVTNQAIRIGSPSNQAANVTFDLNGNRWRGVTPSVATIAFFSGIGETGVVNFSSSSTAIGATGNQVDLLAGSSTSGAFQFGAQGGNAPTPDGRWSVMNINTNLGYGVTVKTMNGAFSTYYFNTGKMTINIDGPGAAFIDGQGSATGIGGFVNATHGGLYEMDVALYIGSYTAGADPATVTIDGALMRTPLGLTLGYGYKGMVILTNNSTWYNGGGFTLGYNRVYSGNPYMGEAIVDGSTMYGQSLQVGYAGYGNGKMTVQNGSTLVLSNGVLNVIAGDYKESAGIGQWARGYTNEFNLYNSTVYLGRAGVDGGVTNWGIIHANGTISGRGPGNFLFENLGGIPAAGITNQATLYVGTQINPFTNVFTYGSKKTTNVVTFAPGKLVLNKGNLQSSTNTWTMFNFSDTTLSQIDATNGFARLLGTNIFALAAGAPAPTNSVKYGLGVYDFVVATNSNINSPQYDNLVNLLTNTYHLTYGVDFQYGVVSLGGGLFALELAFVPEPSTVMLLALGGLLVWRKMVKRHTK